MSSQLGSVKTSPHYNVVKDERGSIIPPTQRPDGTWRKAIRVKEGYVPQDEVPLYESKGKQWANRNSQYPIGFSPVTSNQDSSKPYIPGLVVVEDSSKKSKSKKKSSSNAEQSPGNKESNKEKPEPASIDGSDVSTLKASASKSKKSSKSKGNKTEEKAPAPVAPTEPVVDPKKKLRNVKKKLKEIEAIEAKIKAGGVKAVDADQRKKVETKADVLNEILTLQQLCLVADPWGRRFKSQYYFGGPPGSPLGSQAPP